MPSLSTDITFIDLPNVVPLVTGRQRLNPDLTNGKKIFLCSSEFKSHLKRVFSLRGDRFIRFAARMPAGRCSVSLTF